jgi:hypothetical protein
MSNEFEKIETAAEAEIKKIESIVETWWQTHICNSKASQDTEIYNQLHAAKEDLKQQLVQAQAPAETHQE